MYDKQVWCLDTDIVARQQSIELLDDDQNDIT